MKTIYKYPLVGLDRDRVDLPKSAQILSVESQWDAIVFYALIDTETKETEAYEFATYGTGHLMKYVDITEYSFLDTVKMYDGELMFHVFYKKL